MARQLSLLETRRTWKLSESTREAGRRGVAEARASLQAAIATRSGGPAKGARDSRRRPHAA